MSRYLVALVVAVSALTTAACQTIYPELKITEVANGTVELYLNQSDALGLSDISLSVATSNGHTNDIRLMGILAGNSYLVLFEEPGYTGVPVSTTFEEPVWHRQCPGIKLPENALGGMQLNMGYAMRIEGGSGRGPNGIAGLFFQRWDVSDVVAFGTRPRPSLGGQFVEDTATPVGVPIAGGLALARKWDSSGPIDHGLESDWVLSLVSLCTATN